VSRTTYAALFGAIGVAYGVGDGSSTFNLPNGKGAFLRGTGSQTFGTPSVNYTGPSLGATQQDQMQGHLHPMGITTGDKANLGGGTTIPSNSGSANTSGPVSDGANGTPRTGTETRPFNVGVNFIIKT
jgi:microcystin-dependent protein